MTPESAKASVQAARINGWYDKNWHQARHTGKRDDETRAEFLRIIRRNGSASTARLAAATNTAPNAAFHMLAGMESEGLVKSRLVNNPGGAGGKRSMWSMRE